MIVNISDPVRGASAGKPFENDPPPIFLYVMHPAWTFSRARTTWEVEWHNRAHTRERERGRKWERERERGGERVCVAPNLGRVWLTRDNVNNSFRHTPTESVTHSLVCECTRSLSCSVALSLCRFLAFFSRCRSFALSFAFSRTRGSNSPIRSLSICVARAFSLAATPSLHTCPTEVPAGAIGSILRRSLPPATIPPPAPSLVNLAIERGSSSSSSVNVCVCVCVCACVCVCVCLCVCVWGSSSRSTVERGTESWTNGWSQLSHQQASKWRESRTNRGSISTGSRTNKSVLKPWSAAYCFWSVISSFSNLNRLSSSLGLFCHVPLKKDQWDWDWTLRSNDTPNAIGCTRLIFTHNFPK